MASIHIMEKSHLHLFLCVHALLVCLATNTPNLTKDQNALLALKNITLDPNQPLAKNWSAAASVCEWIGVTCGSLHHRVTALNISNMGLTGTIPPQLGNLSFLVSLDLSQNNFRGELPLELAQLHRLKVLNVRDNNLSGEVPPSICKMSNLEKLLLSNNSLQGTIPSCLSQCTRLHVLILPYNNLSGVIPKELGNLEELEHLYLGYNNLKGAIPKELGRLSKLKTLTLQNNSLTGFIPREVGNLTMLQTLIFDSNYLKGVIPEELGNLQNLEEFYINKNYLYGSIPVGIFNLSMIRQIAIEYNYLSSNLPSTMGYGLPNLEEIYLGSNRLTGPIPHSVSNSSKLIVIQIFGNNLSGFIPDSLGNLRSLGCLNLFSNNLMSNSLFPELSIIDSLVNCRNLMHLDLSDNPLNGTLPNSFGNLSKSIQRIRLSNCKIKGKIPNSIGNLSSLYLLNMQGNHLTGSVPSSFEDMRGLQNLNLGDNKLADRVSLVNLCRLRNLFEINLSQNQISGAIPECLGNITSLRQLFLGSNGLDSRIPVEFWNLKDLLMLNLSSNSLSGSLPLEVGGLKAAIVLDLSMNQISGAIPTSIGGLQRMQYLHLHGNRLEGSIPESIGTILSLVSLDLSHNSLSGLIPRSLERLQFLEYFNVSFNHLSGEIPSGGLFENFTSASFDSNEALCGGSRFHVPPCRTTSGTRKDLRILLILLVVGAIMGAMALGFGFLRYRIKKDKVPSKKDLLSVRTQDRISYYELLQATDGYSESNLLGSGSFGSVYKGTLHDGRILAIKVFNVHQENTFNSFEVECQVLRDLHHRNLIKVISSCSNLDFKALILEFMPNGNLETWLHSANKFLDIMQRLNIMIDVACALNYLHFDYLAPVVHCDIKPSNILLDKDMVAHVSDFGIAKLLGQEESRTYTQTLATLGYMAPEYGLEGSISTKCDVYSYGVILMEVFTGVRPSNDMFGGSLSLRGWVKDSFPNSLAEVIDANMLRPGEENFEGKLECLSSIMEVALNCTMESLKERSNISDALAALKKIKLQLSICM